MRRQRIRGQVYFLLGLCAIVLATLGQQAQAAPNGLTQIPIAKVFGDGVAAFSVARSAEGSQSTVYTTQYGIGNQFEFGVDYQDAPSSQRTFLGNLKVLLAHHPGRLPDVAAGLQNIATGQKSVPYLVATTQPRATGVSLGAIRPGGGAYYPFAGLSYNVTPTIEIVADSIGGRASYGTVGVIANLTKTITLNVAYAHPNTAGNAAGDGLNPRGYIVNLAYVFHLKGGAKAGGEPSTSKQPTAGSGGQGGAK